MNQEKIGEFIKKLRHLSSRKQMGARSKYT